MDLGLLMLLLLMVKIFLAELGVVTFGTLRIIFVSRGMKTLAPILGFFEVTTWLWAISQVMLNSGGDAGDVGPTLARALAFAGGFSLGSYLGIVLEEKLALGTSLIRIVTSKDPGELVRNLHLNDFGVTYLEGQGATGPVQVVLTVVKRKDVERATSLIRQFDCKVFYSIDEVQTVNEGVFSAARSRPGIIPNPFRMLRKERIPTGSAMP